MIYASYLVTTSTPRIILVILWENLVPFVFSAGSTHSADSTKILKLIIDKRFAKQAEDIPGNIDPGSWNNFFVLYGTLCVAYRRTAINQNTLFP